MQWIPSRSRGFTLLEVLVATTIIAVALGAIIKSTGAGTNNIAYLRDKTFAHWVAMNQMAQLQTSGNYPAVGRKSGEEEMGGRDWYWDMEVKKTPDKDVRRVEISVRQQKRKTTAAIALLTGFFTHYSSSTGISGLETSGKSANDESK